MLRVAINAVSTAPGGALNSMSGYLGGLHDIGSRMDVTVYASRPQVIDALGEVPGAKIVPFAAGQPPHKHFLMQQTILGRMMEESGADVVFGGQFRVGNCRLPQIVHHENMYRFRHPGMLGGVTQGFTEFVRDKFARHSLRHATRNLFNSSYIRQAAEKIAPETKPRNSVIHLGVSRAVLDIAAQPSNPWTREPLLLAIQSPEAHKDNPTLLRTIRQLMDGAPRTAWRLAIAGPGNWAQEEKLARSLGIADRIKFLGYVAHSELSKLMARAVCLLVTSRLESFGLPMIESMACGCPVVSSNATALPEVLGDAGILVEPGRPDLFAQAVLKLSSNETLRQDLVERGSQRVQNFKWTHAAMRLSQLLHDAAGEVVETVPELVAAA